MQPELRRVIHNYISNEFEEIFKYEMNINRRDSVYWLDKKSKNKVVFELELSGYFWINYEYWHRISSTFSLDYSQTQEIIIEWIVENIDEIKNIHKGNLKFEMSNDEINFAWMDVTRIFRQNN